MAYFGKLSSRSDNVAKMTRIKRNTAIISIVFDSLIAVKHGAYLGTGQGELFA